MVSSLWTVNQVEYRWLGVARMVCRSFRTDDQIDGPEGPSLQFRRVLSDMGARMRTVLAVAIHIAMSWAGLFQPLSHSLTGSLQVAAKIALDDISYRHATEACGPRLSDR